MSLIRKFRFLKINLNILYVECMTKQMKSLYYNISNFRFRRKLIMSCKNMGIENVVSKQKNKKIFIIFNRELETEFYIIQKKTKLIEISM